ncbi:MAG TPA: AzlD domain-containing protein [Egicoccus sp.]|nr:AzlD domain-containing protein [Egicoccus sp.]HSK22263.1 AzlD domain-containing protein [Egicoccus sp.]
MGSAALWVAVLAGSAGCYAIKLAGLSVPDRILEHPRMQRVAAMLPVALLAALVAVQTLADGSRLVLDARVAGVAVAIVAVRLRAPFLVVVLAATLTTALLRL